MTTSRSVVEISKGYEDYTKMKRKPCWSEGFATQDLLWCRIYYAHHDGANVI